MIAESSIYHGSLNHCRLLPKRHDFTYKVFMVYLDLDEVEGVFALSRLWSAKNFALAWLKRSDFIGPSSLDIKTAIIHRIKKETGEDFSGSVRMLANLRYFGFSMNPIVSYYCFDEYNKLRYIVAEVTNTPWKEKHAYVLQCHPEQDIQRIRFNKELHVSPFNPMDLQYRWQSNMPGSQLVVMLENWQEDVKQFSATLNLEREEITGRVLTKLVLAYPFMTMKIGFAIYWQALRLYLKGIKFVGHPKLAKLSHEK